MQCIISTSPFGFLKASKSEIVELEGIYGRLTLVYGPIEALTRLFDYFRLRWTSKHIESNNLHFHLHTENRSSEDWLMKNHAKNNEERSYILWTQKNFLLVCQQTEIPVYTILKEEGDDAFISPKLFNTEF